MSPHVTAKAPFPHPFPARPRPNPAAGAEVISYFLDCLGLLIRQAVQEAMQETAPSGPAKNTPLVGGIELAQEITGLSKARIYALVSQRGIVHSKRGNKLYFTRAQLMAWVTEGNRAERKNGR